MQELVEGGEEGGFYHGAALDAFVDDDDFVEFLGFVGEGEFLDEEGDFFFLIVGEVIALSGGHADTGAGTDSDDLGGLFADFLYFGLVIGAGEGALDEGDIELVEDIVGLEDAGVADVERLAPDFVVVIQEFSEDNGRVLAAGEREPADTQFFSGERHRVLFQKERYPTSIAEIL